MKLVSFTRSTLLRHSLSYLLREFLLLVDPLTAAQNVNPSEANRRPVEHEIKVPSMQSNPLRNRLLKRLASEYTTADNLTLTVHRLYPRDALYSESSVEETADCQWHVAFDGAFAGDVAFRVQAVRVQQRGRRFVGWRVGEDHIAVNLHFVRRCNCSHGAVGRRVAFR